MGNRLIFLELTGAVNRPNPPSFISTTMNLNREPLIPLSSRVWGRYRSYYDGEDPGDWRHLAPGNSVVIGALTRGSAHSGELDQARQAEETARYYRRRAEDERQLREIALLKEQALGEEVAKEREAGARRAEELRVAEEERDEARRQLLQAEADLEELRERRAWTCCFVRRGRDRAPPPYADKKQ